MKHWYEKAVKERQEKKDREEVTLFLAKKEVDEVTPKSTSTNKISKKQKNKKTKSMEKNTKK